MAENDSSMLHPVLRRRWSPLSFDPEATATDHEVESLTEAARWAPSAGNSQPWAFIVGRRGTPEHHRLTRHLAGSSSRWAPSAAVLVANLSHRLVADTDWPYSEFVLYDLGQAVAHMTFQAHSLGMHVRQFRAFDRDAVAEEFNVPLHWEVSTMSAIGRASDSGDHDAIPARERRPGHEMLWPAADTSERAERRP